VSQEYTPECMSRAYQFAATRSAVPVPSSILLFVLVGVQLLLARG
jgi:hypothetical protein